MSRRKMQSYHSDNIRVILLVFSFTLYYKAKNVILFARKQASAHIMCIPLHGISRSLNAVKHKQNMHKQCLTILSIVSNMFGVFKHKNIPHTTTVS